MKNSLRNILRYFYYLKDYYFFQSKKNTNSNGEPLKPGITAVISARNEAYTIPLCLESLIGFADEIVCIDNGSDDNTLQLMHDFKAKFGQQIEVTVLHMPGALLGDCRNAGLKHSHYQWHYRCDADMVCNYSGKNNCAELRRRIMDLKYPTAIKLPRIDLVADFHHITKNAPAISPGEYFLIWNNQDIRYEEFGKFDAIKIPLYYKLEDEKDIIIFHLAGLKSMDNLIHRFHYFSWREATNKNPEDKSILNFEDYKTKYNQYYFGTNDKLSVKYRYIKQILYHYSKADMGAYGGFPRVIENHIKQGLERFKVEYQNGIPSWRSDAEDKEMLGYVPTEEDLSWQPIQFFRKLLPEAEVQALIAN